MSDDGWEEESSTTPSFGGGAVREIILLFNLATSGTNLHIFRVVLCIKYVATYLCVMIGFVAED